MLVRYYGQFRFLSEQLCLNIDGGNEDQETQPEQPISETDPMIIDNSVNEGLQDHILNKLDEPKPIDSVAAAIVDHSREEVSDDESQLFGKDWPNETVDQIFNFFPVIKYIHTPI